MSKPNPFGQRVSYKPKQASVNPEPIQEEYLGLTDRQIESVGDLFLENDLIKDIIHVNMKSDNEETIRSIFDNTSSYNSFTKKAFLTRDIGRIMLLLGISPNGSNIKQYGDFWSALSESIKTVKSLSNSSSSAATSAAAPSVSSSSASNKLTPSERAAQAYTSRELTNKGLKLENFNALGGGARRRRRKTKKARKIRRTHRNNKKRST
jgi:hypothetical protein